MQIDWLTVAAQIANFLVLIWLLQRFLYRPITEAMARREARIEERLADAKTRRREAEEEAEDLRTARKALEESRQKMLAEAHAEADDLRHRLEQDARDEVAQKRTSWQEMLDDERTDFVREMQRNAGHKVLDVCGRLLTEFASVGLDDPVAQGFVAKLKDLDSDTCKKVTDAANGADGPALVTTATALGAAARRVITRAIHEQFGAGIDVNYQEDEKLLLGARLSIGEQTVDWSAARYLKRLNRDLDELLDKARPTARENATANRP